jgi:hypothetical protein
MSSQLTAKQHPRPYGHVAALIHPRGLSTGCRAWRGRSSCCGRMWRCPALSRAFRLLGWRRGLGVGVGTWFGRGTPLPAADRRRAGHRPRGKPNLGVEAYLSRDLRQPDSPPRPGLSRNRRHRRSADRRRPSRRTAATLTRPEQAERAGRTRHWSNACQTSGASRSGGVLQPARNRCDRGRARPMMYMQEFGGCPVIRAADPLILDSAARTRCPADLVGDADHTLPGRVGPTLPTTNRTQAGGGTGKGKSNHG